MKIANTKLTYPSIKNRYTSTFIDSICILLISLGIAALFEQFPNTPDYMRGVAFIIVVLLRTIFAKFIDICKEHTINMVSA